MAKWKQFQMKIVFGMLILACAALIYFIFFWLSLNKATKLVNSRKFNQTLSIAASEGPLDGRLRSELALFSVSYRWSIDYLFCIDSGWFPFPKEFCIMGGRLLLSPSSLEDCFFFCMAELVISFFWDD
jgi:hypothetical protein